LDQAWLRLAKATNKTIAKPKSGWEIPALKLRMLEAGTTQTHSAFTPLECRHLVAECSL
jgi:hypothetical protein